MYSYLFCFFKQKTAYELRISDWSSDVCSSDLEGLDAAPLAAVAGRPRQFLRRRPGQGIVAPLAGDGVAADERPAGHHNAAADSGSQDDAEHHGEARGGAVGGFRERKAVGVVHQPHRTAKRGGEVAVARVYAQRTDEHTPELK